MASDRILYYDDEFIRKFEKLRDVIDAGDRRYLHRFLIDNFGFIFEAFQYYAKQGAEGNVPEFEEADEETKRELMKWLCRLAKRLIVHNISVTLAGDTGHLIITDSDPYFEMYECDDEPCWTDYLRWERDPYSGLPLQLASKYYDDEEIKSELKRREEWRERR